jgi:hypothetical protein
MSTSHDPSPSKRDRLPCPTCGGSGVLRMNHHRFRTCLECIGQWLLLQFNSSPELARLLQRRTELDQAAPARTGADTQSPLPAEISVNAGIASAFSR